MQKKNVLITGGAGFIGSRLCVELIKNDYKITVLDNLSEQVHGPAAQLPISLQGKVEFIHGDVTSKQDWLKALDNNEIIVHLAAETGTGQSMYEVTKYSDVNIGGTAMLMDLLANERHSIKKLVIASSRAIYGEGKYVCDDCGVVHPLQRKESDLSNGLFEPRCPYCAKFCASVATDEHSMISANSIYGLTKYMQEQMFSVMGNALNIPFVGLRYQNVFGAGQSLQNPYTGILSIFTTRILNGNNLNIFEDGDETRDFVHVDDVVRATFLAIESEAANNQVLNVGSGVATSVRELTSQLITNLGRDVKVSISGNYRLGDIRHNFADLNKITQLIGFRPIVSLEAGIKEFTDWALNEAIQADNFDKSITELKKRRLLK